MKSKKTFYWNNIDVWLVLSVIILTFIGIVMVYNSSSAIAVRDFSDKYYYAREQLNWLIIGFLAMAAFSFFRYKFFIDMALYIYIINIILLILVFFPGIGINALGASRWLKLGPIGLQPSELMKLSMIIYLSKWLSNRNPNFISFFVILIITVFLILIQPDMGTTMVILLTMFMIYFSSNAKIVNFLLMVPIVTLGAVFYAISSPYRLRRLSTFINPESDPQGASYQIRQALLAIGSGGLFGIGLGQSRQKYEYLPESNTDSIFAIWSEETGFIGSVMLLVIYLFLIYRIFKIAQSAPDNFSKYICVGIGSWLSIQIIINIGSITGMMPLTGVPLPLLSYGGSSLIIIMSALGLVLNISSYAKQTK